MTSFLYIYTALHPQHKVSHIVIELVELDRKWLLLHSVWLFISSIYPRLSVCARKRVGSRLVGEW